MTEQTAAERGGAEQGGAEQAEVTPTSLNITLAVPAIVKEALQRVQAVVFELALHDPDTVSGLIDCKQLEQGRSLRGLLPAPLFHRLKACERAEKVQ